MQVMICDISLLTITSKQGTIESTINSIKSPCFFFSFQIFIFAFFFSAPESQTIVFRSFWESEKTKQNKKQKN